MQKIKDRKRFWLVNEKILIKLNKKKIQIEN